MEPQQRKLVAGMVVFIGIIAVGVAAYNIVRFFTSLPSGAEVGEFAKNLWDDAPTVKEVVTGTLLPDEGTPSQTESGTSTTLPTTPTTNASTSTPPKSDWLTPGQRKILATLGIDETDLPATLTPELETCLVAKIGQERFTAVKSGATPTVAEGLKAMACL